MVDDGCLGGTEACVNYIDGKGEEDEVDRGEYGESN